MVGPERQGSFSENQKNIEKYRTKKFLFTIKKN